MNPETYSPAYPLEQFFLTTRVEYNEPVESSQSSHEPEPDYQTDPNIENGVAQREPMRSNNVDSGVHSSDKNDIESSDSETLFYPDLRALSSNNPDSVNQGCFIVMHLLCRPD